MQLCEMRITSQVDTSSTRAHNNCRRRCAAIGREIRLCGLSWGVDERWIAVDCAALTHRKVHRGAERRVFLIVLLRFLQVIHICTGTCPHLHRDWPTSAAQAAAVKVRRSVRRKHDCWSSPGADVGQSKADVARPGADVAHTATLGSALMCMCGTLGGWGGRGD